MSVPCSPHPDLFFSDVTVDIEAAKKLCKTCPYEARAKCLMIGIEADRDARRNGNHRGTGVFGGCTPIERDAAVRDSKAGPGKRAYTQWGAGQIEILCAGVRDGVRYQEIAARLGVSEMAVRKRVGTERKNGTLS